MACACGAEGYAFCRGVYTCAGRTKCVEDVCADDCSGWRDGVGSSAILRWRPLRKVAGYDPTPQWSGDMLTKGDGVNARRRPLPPWQAHV